MTTVKIQRDTLVLYHAKLTRHRVTGKFAKFEYGK